jgi:hypothetical protein
MGKKITKYDQKIYFICKGTDTNDVIESINNENKNTKSYVKISKDDYSRLDEIGIKEMHMCQTNPKVNNKIKDIKKIYTSLDYCSIESASVILSNDKLHNIVIYPLPYMSTEKIKDKKQFDIFKKKFGDYTIKNKKEEITNMEKYWHRKKINYFLDTNHDSFKINWKEFYDKNPSSLLYSYHKFYETLGKLCSDNDNDNNDNNDNDNDNNDINVLFFICSHKLLIDILKKCSTSKYNKKIDIIERSSVWEITVDIEYEYISSKNINTNIIFKKFDKIYPSENNHVSLNYNENSSLYTYTYNRNKFILFDSSIDIPLQYLKKLSLSRYSKEKQDLIKSTITPTNLNIINNHNNTSFTKNTNLSPILKKIKLENLE